MQPFSGSAARCSKLPLEVEVWRISRRKQAIAIKRISRRIWAGTPACRRASFVRWRGSRSCPMLSDFSKTLTFGTGYVSSSAIQA
jgi:hypothetical protein